MSGRRPGVVLHASSRWQRVYALARAAPPETWRRGVFRPDGHSVSVSDLYFIGHHLGLVGTELALTHRLQRDGILTERGRFHAADILLKCIGFQINEGNERLLGRARTSADGAVDDGLFALVESHLDERANGLPLVGHVSGLNWAANSMVSYWRDASLERRRPLHARDMVGTVVHPRVRLNHMTASESTDALMRSVAADPALRSLLEEHVREVADACHVVWSAEAYLEINQRQWSSLNSQMLSRAHPDPDPNPACKTRPSIQADAMDGRTDGRAGSEPMPYPFGDVLQVLRMEAPALLQPVASTGAGAQPALLQQVSSAGTGSVGAFQATLAPRASSSALVQQLVPLSVSQRQSSMEAAGAPSSLTPGVDWPAAAHALCSRSAVSTADAPRGCSLAPSFHGSPAHRARAVEPSRRRGDAAHGGGYRLARGDGALVEAALNDGRRALANYHL